LVIETGELEKRAEELTARLEKCSLCPRACGVNRLKDEKGYCRTGRKAKVSSYGPHLGEEPELVGAFGSGTVFFADCNLQCAFCQNYSLSHLGEGWETDATGLAGIMLSLAKRGCHNLNLVSPTHVIAQAVEALAIARRNGLSLPVVYNSGGYDSVATLKVLEGVVDIYMPDAKYAGGAAAEKFSDAPDYPEVMKEALKEMHRQVGDLVVDEDGIARRGLIIRHLVLPGNLAGTDEIVRFIAEEISVDSYVNVMEQYRPCGKAADYPEINRCPTLDEYRRAVEAAKAAGLHRFAFP
jgi:putative pyruvate formate lyase activating enzyme